MFALARDLKGYLPIPFDCTYIMYDPSDLICYAAVHFSLLPVYLVIFYFSWFILTREIEPVLVVAGHLVGESTNKVVKNILKLPRPDFHKDFGKGSYGLSYGMPSAHSQFMGLFATYFICIVLFKTPNHNRTSKMLMTVPLVLASILVAFSRVYLFYHTAPQVIVGLLVGVVLGLLLFVFSSMLRDVGIVDWVLDWPLVRYFNVKDSYYHCYQTFEDEYDSFCKRKWESLKMSLPKMG